MAFATPTDMKLRYDVRRLGQLVMDDGTEASSDDLDTNLVLQFALMDGEGQIMSSVRIGKKYSEADLIILTTDPTGDAAQLALFVALTGSTNYYATRSFIVRLNCDLAYGFLLLRRGFPEAEVSSLAPAFGLAMKNLERLRLGEAIFPITVNAAAGKTVTNVPHNPPAISSETRFFGLREQDRGVLSS